MPAGLYSQPAPRGHKHHKQIPPKCEMGWSPGFAGEDNVESAEGQTWFFSHLGEEYL